MRNLNMHVTWNKQEINLLKKWHGKIFIHEVQKQFLPTKTKASIRQKAFRLGLKSSLHPKVYFHNENYFTNLNTENCYWAGFISADGNICNYGHGDILRISLSRKDRQHLENFKYIIRSNNNVKDIISIDKKRKIKSYLSLLYICNAKQICFDLKKNFNIVPAKSLILKSPNLLQENDIRSFIRGNMDGDGGIYYNKSTKTWGVGFLGTKEMLTWIKFNIQKYIKQVGNPSILPIGNIYRLTFAGNLQTKSILNWIYRDSQNISRLKRKYDKYKEFKNDS